jgi:hypothetical protein
LILVGLGSGARLAAKEEDEDEDEGEYVGCMSAAKCTSDRTQGSGFRVQEEAAAVTVTLG